MSNAHFILKAPDIAGLETWMFLGRMTVIFAEVEDLMEVI
jgi:hypothetical protein